MIEFFEECTPPTITAQQRRHKYKQVKLKQAEAFWMAVMEKHKPDKPLDGALVSEISITYPHTEKSRKLCDKQGLIAIPMITTLDCDNINKLPQDAMQKCGYMVNDSRIFNLNITKWRGDYPGVAVKLYQDDYWSAVMEGKGRQLAQQRIEELLQPHEWLKDLPFIEAKDDKYKVNIETELPDCLIKSHKQNR